MRGKLRSNQFGPLVRSPISAERVPVTATGENDGPPKETPALKYRREIDGLRAVAVVPVIFFHAGFQSFQGGYVGVDVFFVISGYLISTILFREFDLGKFSFRGFYERRARRILPALVFVCLLSSIFAWTVLFPAGLEEFSKSLIGVSVFSSNFVFWRQVGYFESSAHLKPLLHTWSLAVEEQFYLFFPILLWVMWRLNERLLWLVLSSAVASSLVLAQWLSISHPAAAFFLLPTRIWELGLGALAALALLRRAHLVDALPGKELLSAVGLGAIVLAVLAYEETTPFPGFYALLPTFGTVFIILFARPRTIVGTILGSPILVGIGLISYSAYLYHQPVLAFARNYKAEVLSVSELLGLIGISFVLAFATWKFIEVPFRDRARISVKKILVLSVCGTVSMFGIGALGVMAKGAPWRFSQGERTLLDKADYKVAMKEFSLRQCFLDSDQTVSSLVGSQCVSTNALRPKIIIAGDSEAAHLVAGARSLTDPSKAQLMQWTATSCRPGLVWAEDERCAGINSYLEHQIFPLLGEQDVLILAGNWGETYASLGREAFEAKFQQFLVRLQSVKASVVVVGDAPNFEVEPVQRVLRVTQVDGPRAQAVSADRISYPGAAQYIKRQVTRAGFTYFDPSSVICAGKSLRECYIYEGNELIFTDRNHLSGRGSCLVMRRLFKTPVLTRYSRPGKDNTPTC